MQRIGNHFHLSEFEDWRSEEAIPEKALGGLVLLVRWALDPLRERFGVTRVTSGHRSDASNELVGGAPNSHHRYALHPWSPAADVMPESGTPTEWATFLDQQGIPMGIGLYSTHVHVDLRTNRARWNG